MNNINVLDCTLRDGGYCNNWNFGLDNIKRIICSLIDSNVEIIECGFISNKKEYDSNASLFSDIGQISKIIPENREGKLFVAMINYGEYNINDLPAYDGTSVDGIRVAFHKKNINDALDFCKQIKNKGYRVFIQAMVSLSYSDEEFLDLIKKVNSFNPYAFYIVDSFGIMKSKDLTRMFYMVEHNLNDSVWIGFHSHNNMQLSYSNAQNLVSIQTNRNLIIDTSIMGMGRGAGNLNTELFVDFLNENAKKDYNIRPLLYIIDETINCFYQQNYWGYSLPNYISAVHNAHPDYAKYLDSKKTLTIGAMDEIFDMIDKEKKESFNKNYIEDLYKNYQEKNNEKKTHFSEFVGSVSGKDVLMIAPGKSSVTERNKILDCAKSENTVVISINYDFDSSVTDYIFVSNLRRYRDIPARKREKCIVTSNIPSKDVFLQVSYKELLNNVEFVQDNAGLMLARLLSNIGVNKLYLAGMDGYSSNSDDNYADKNMNIFTERQISQSKNNGLMKVLKDIQKSVDIEFITTPNHLII